MTAEVLMLTVKTPDEGLSEMLLREMAKELEGVFTPENSATEVNVPCDETHPGMLTCRFMELEYLEVK